jgi:hypothetical protein
LWLRFAEACGISGPSAAVVDLGGVPVANRSLGAAQVAVLRQLNADLAGRLGPREHARLVKRDLAEGLLADRTDGLALIPLRTPAALADVLVPAARAWHVEIAAGDCPVHGDLTELDPVLAGPRDPHPDAVPDAATAAVATAALAGEVLRRAAAERVDSRHESTGTAGGAAPAARVADRVRRRLGFVDRG